MKLTNYYIHPSDNRYLVFEFRDAEMANYFQSKIQDNNIWFEKHLENEVSYFGIRKSDQKLAININFLTHGAFRKPMIHSKSLRYLLLIATLAFVLLALIGYLKSK